MTEPKLILKKLEYLLDGICCVKSECYNSKIRHSAMFILLKTWPQREKLILESFHQKKTYIRIQVLLLHRLLCQNLEKVCIVNFILDEFDRMHIAE